MKNELTHENSIFESLISTDDGTDSVVINGATLPQSSWLGSGNYTFTSGSVTVTIRKIEAITGNVILMQEDDNTFYLSCAHGSGDVDIENSAVTFAEAATRTNIASGETVRTLFGKIKKWFSDLKAVAFSGSYNDLSDKPTIVTGVKGNIETSYRTGNVNLTPANVGAVNKAGDTMTGRLNINAPSASTAVNYSDIWQGNNTPTGTVGNSRGRLIQYSTTQYYSVFQPADGYTGNRSHVLNDIDGHLVDANVPLKLNWSGQSGQPSWLFGGNGAERPNMYVYNPSNFSVAYAASAGAATRAAGTNQFAYLGNIGGGASLTLEGSGLYMLRIVFKGNSISLRTFFAFEGSSTYKIAEGYYYSDDYFGMVAINVNESTKVISGDTSWYVQQTGNGSTQNKTKTDACNLIYVYRVMYR